MNTVTAHKGLYSVGFYNLENFYDTFDDTLINDQEFLPNGVKQWTLDKYQDKVERLATVISSLGNESIGGGIQILGVSEIENKSVLEDLIKSEKLQKRDYKIIHYNSPDLRGVDVGLIYDSKYFVPIKTSSIPLFLYDEANDSARIYTRDVLLVKGIIANEVVYITVNHWPSRRGGEEQSRSRRINAAALNKRILDSIKIQEPNAKFILLGDLNDNPNNESIKTVLAAKKELHEVSDMDLYNPFYKNYLNGEGTTAYNDSWSLFDQIIISPSLTKENSLHYVKNVIFRKDFMIEQFGKYKNHPKRTFSGDLYNYGYSDHFPVFIYLEK